jgi:hypothetical protein
MSEVVPPWAVVASLALHATLIALGSFVPRHRSIATFASDFWSGKSFEVPDAPSNPPEGEAPSYSSESRNEINVDGIDISSNNRAQNPDLHPPKEGALASRPARAHTEARATASASTPAGAPARASSAGSGFGAEGSAPGVRDLLRSFVRTIPIVANSDPVWSSLPLGAAGSADVTLALDDEGRPRMASALPAAAHLRRLIQKTVSVMSSGRFGIASTEGIPTEQKFHIAVTLTQEAAPAENQAASGGAFALGFDPPDDRNVSHAFFTLASGRHVEVAVRPVPR